jgi:hypothetical protein
LKSRRRERTLNTVCHELRSISETRYSLFLTMCRHDLTEVDQMKEIISASIRLAQNLYLIFRFYRHGEKAWTSKFTLIRKACGRGKNNGSQMEAALWTLPTRTDSLFHNSQQTMLHHFTMTIHSLSPNLLKKQALSTRFAVVMPMEVVQDQI